MVTVGTPPLVRGYGESGTHVGRRPRIWSQYGTDITHYRPIEGIVKLLSEYRPQQALFVLLPPGAPRLVHAPGIFGWDGSIGTLRGRTLRAVGEDTDQTHGDIFCRNAKSICIGPLHGEPDSLPSCIIWIKDVSCNWEYQRKSYQTGWVSTVAINKVFLLKRVAMSAQRRTFF